MPASWAAGRMRSRNAAFWKPSHVEPVRTKMCVSPAVFARATMTAALPPSLFFGFHTHMPLPSGTTGLGGGGGGATVVVGSTGGAATVTSDVVGTGALGRSGRGATGVAT